MLASTASLILATCSCRALYSLTLARVSSSDHRVDGSPCCAAQRSALAFSACISAKVVIISAYFSPCNKRSSFRSVGSGEGKRLIFLNRGALDGDDAAGVAAAAAASASFFFFLAAALLAASAASSGSSSSSLLVKTGVARPFPDAREWDRSSALAALSLPFTPFESADGPRGDGSFLPNFGNDAVSRSDLAVTTEADRDGAWDGRPFVWLGGGFKFWCD